MERNLFNLNDFEYVMNLGSKDLAKSEKDQYLLELSSLCHLFNETQSDRDIPKHLNIFNPPKNICDELILFPGSFSPWHKGHAACVLGCEQKPVLIIPDFNPWKGERSTDSWEDFVAIYRFILEAPRKGIYLYPGFLIKSESNPTVEWLPKLPLPSKRLLMGDDSFLSLHKWKEAQKLISSLEELYICPRKGEEDELEEQSNNLKEEFQIKINFLPSHDYQELSSTSLRK